MVKVDKLQHSYVILELNSFIFISESLLYKMRLLLLKHFLQIYLVQSFIGIVYEKLLQWIQL